MPYYIGDVIKDAKNLIARTPEKFAETGVDIRLNTTVEEIDIRKGEIRTAGGDRLPYDVLVMGTGSTATMPPIPGIELEGVFKLKTLRDGIAIKAYIDEKLCTRAVIVGAGFIAMEMCEGLRKRGIETQVVYRGELPVKKWDPEFSKVVLDEITGHGVSFLTHRTPEGIERAADGSLRLMTSGGTIETDMIIFALGVKPETELARAVGLTIGESGAIKVDFSQRTSMESVFAVGDCCEVYHRVSKEWVNIPLGDIANKQGRIAGSNIGGTPMIFPGVVGAQCFKVFGLEVAATGLDERAAIKSGYHPVSNLIWGTFVARSLSGGSQPRIGLKLIADRSTGKLLGAQAVGGGGAVSRINTLSACLWAEMDLAQIGFMDLAYAPPFGGAWDIIQTGAQILGRKL